MGIVKILLWVVFVIVSLLLIAIVLMQEGKGGGLGSAFGGAGGDAFGHGAGSINKFTSWLAGTFMVTALILAMLETN